MFFTARPIAGKTESREILPEDGLIIRLPTKTVVNVDAREKVVNVDTGKIDNRQYSIIPPSPIETYPEYTTIKENPPIFVERFASPSSITIQYQIKLDHDNKHDRKILGKMFLSAEENTSGERFICVSHLVYPCSLRVDDDIILNPTAYLGIVETLLQFAIEESIRLGFNGALKIDGGIFDLKTEEKKILYKKFAPVPKKDLTPSNGIIFKANDYKSFAVWQARIHAPEQSQCLIM